MKDYLRLIRLPNLLIIAVTMILIRYSVIVPLLGIDQINPEGSFSAAAGLSPLMPLTEFILLVLATVLLAGAGYIINDYFDIKTDLINRGEIIVGTRISRRKAMLWHNILNIAGVATGFYISWRIGYPILGILFVIVSGLLYFYSARYKRRFLVGNVIVAILTAMVPILVIIYDAPSVNAFLIADGTVGRDIADFFIYVGGFSLFAFLTTLSREIIKDVEDYRGDVEYGRRTMPIVLGIKVTKMIIIFLQALTLLLLFTFLILYFNNLFSVVYLLLFVALPLMLIVFLIVRSSTRNQFHIVSRLMKVIMIAGVLYTILFKYTLV